MASRCVLGPAAEPHGEVLRVRLEENGELVTMNIVEAVEDPHLLGAAFRDLRSWRPWLVFLKAAFAIPMDEVERELYRQSTGRELPPSEPVKEGWVIAGRGAGKSRIAATVAVFLATFRDCRSVLAPGERGIVMLLAADRAQARVLLRYVVGMLESSELLAGMVEEELKESVKLTNGIDIEIHTSNYSSRSARRIRGAVLSGPRSVITAGKMGRCWYGARRQPR